MSLRNERTNANFTLLQGTTTGISAHDRALTASMLASPSSTSGDFNRPGHLCPLRARQGGVLTRRGHTEAGLGEPNDFFFFDHHQLVSLNHSFGTSF
jgi:3,4-dihydroxy-2-butanone 4-phosphate synthase